MQLVVAPAPDPVPWKPNVVDAPLPSWPLYEAFETWTVPDVPEAVPLHMLVMVAPLGRPRVTLQLVMALRAVTVTEATNPPFQALVTL